MTESDHSAVVDQTRLKSARLGSGNGSILALYQSMGLMEHEMKNMWQFNAGSFVA